MLQHAKFAWHNLYSYELNSVSNKPFATIGSHHPIWLRVSSFVKMSLRNEKSATTFVMSAYNMQYVRNGIPFYIENFFRIFMENALLWAKHFINKDS